MPDPSLPLDSRAEEIFRDYLARVDAGEPPEFEGLCRANPKLERELRELKRAIEIAARLRPSTTEDRPLAERLRAKFGAQTGPTASLDDEPRPESGPSSALFDKLRGAGTRGTRYRLIGEVARGGMGVILKIWDDELRRMLAMKVVLGRGNESSGGTPQVDPKTLGRFLEEAQVTGQLDHPGIVPVHELGLGSDGRVYFTMRLVKGVDLRTIFERVRTGEDGWNQVRALGVILKVCEAMSYAHSKKVVHRDLKPANVMVGKFGEVYVMDWGLARVLGREDKHDLRIQLPQTTQSVRTERGERREETPDSPLVTMDGDIVGTPSFMPLEQARGEIEKLGPHSDVYALGAMLYQLLTGEMPYVPAGARVSNYTILDAVLRRTPDPIESLAPDTPPELVAICEKAMAREISARYADTQEFASDLRAYLEGRVVRAYETGTWAETRKWVRRNKPLAASLAAAVVILISGVVTSSVFGKRASARAADALAARNDLKLKNTELEGANSALAQATSHAEANATIANEQARIARESESAARSAKEEAEQERDRVLGLADLKRLSDLRQEADSLWPAFKDKIPALESWLTRAGELVERLPRHREHLAKVEQQLAVVEAASQRLQTLAEGVENVTVTPVTIRTTNGIELGWIAQQLRTLITGIEGVSKDGGSISSIQSRLTFARSVDELSVSGPEPQRRWAEVTASIKSSPKHAGLELAPQVGLVPIGMDSESGLWEFAHLQTGEPAVRGADGRLVVNEQTGLVFVLIPAGSFWMGAQADDPTGQNYDPLALPHESPVHKVTLSAYMISKYEMTQGQWLRSTGRNPSEYTKTSTFNGHQVDLTHPVEQVGWTECMELMKRLGLILPSEAQLEYGCRGGTDTPWWTGSDRESLRGKVNIADQSARSASASWPDINDWPDLDDGWAVHAPVGSLPPNGYGLHEVHGNVWEWCRDGSANFSAADQVDPLTPSRATNPCMFRGGSFTESAVRNRSASRFSRLPESKSFNLGLRPARSITP